MKTHKILKPALYKTFCQGVGISLLLLIMVHTAAGSAHTGEGLYPLSLLAVDDSGPGFWTDEDSILYTASVLTNDIDSTGGDLFVSAFDDSLTKGTVIRRDGGLDLTFGEGGKVDTHVGFVDQVKDVILQPDGKVILIGSFYNGDTGSDFTLLRHNPDGSLDQSFGDGGIVITNLNWTDIAYKAATQTDGKIVAAGIVFDNSIGLARYLMDGSLDPDFDGDGKVILSGHNFNDCGHMGLAIQPDGKIVVVGTSADVTGYFMFLARFTPGGALDMDFGDDGIVKTGYQNFTYGFDLALQPDGKILVSGYGSGVDVNQSGIILARFYSDGSLDTSLGGSGFVFTYAGPINYSSLGVAVALQDDNKIVVTGKTNEEFVLVRYNANGSLDTTFSQDGMLLNRSMTPRDVAIQKNGKILVAGSGGLTAQETDMALARYNPDGSIDMTFGEGGTAYVDFDQYDDGHAVAVGKNGLIVLAGVGNDNFALARLHGDGAFAYDPRVYYEYLEQGEVAYDSFTYTVSNGSTTDTATVTITIEGRVEDIYLPVVFTPAGIYGMVKERGIAAANVPLSLRFYNGSSWSEAAVTTTNSDGSYMFSSIPSLLPGQLYYIRFYNEYRSDRLFVWGTRQLESYTSNTMVDMGAFEISNLGLVSPFNESYVPLPCTFQWEPRIYSLNESYEFNLFDPFSDETYFYTDLLGHVDHYTLPGLPPGFSLDEYYAWDVWIYDLDGGYGISFDAWWVAFYDEGKPNQLLERFERSKVHSYPFHE